MLQCPELIAGGLHQGKVSIEFNSCFLSSPRYYTFADIFNLFLICSGFWKVLAYQGCLTSWQDILINQHMRSVFFLSTRTMGALRNLWSLLVDALAP